MAYTKENFLVGLRKAVIAKMTGTPSAVIYGTSYQLEVANMATVTAEPVTDRLEGDDTRSALYAVFVGGTIHLEFAFKSLSLYQALFGSTVIDSNTYQQLPVTNTIMPYFGLCVEVVDQDGIMSADLWVPLCKVQGNVGFPVQYGKYWRMSFDAQFILCTDTRYPYHFDIIEHSGIVAPTIPPTYS